MKKYLSAIMKPTGRSQDVLPRGNRALLLATVACVLILGAVVSWVSCPGHRPRIGSPFQNASSSLSSCTLFASPSGNDQNSGTSPTAPKTISGAASKTEPGSVVCLLAGTYGLSATFYPPKGGTPTAWIVYKSYGDGDVNVVWTAGATGQPMVKLGSGNLASNPAYLEFRGLKLDGQGLALDGFFCAGSHHLRFIENTINNTGGAGIASIGCDYLTSDHNIINHNGYLYGWTSGISYNSIPWYDAYPGFHNIISNNVIAGEYDGSPHHTDGNGIILDLSSDGIDKLSAANTPSALVINNVVYGNGGRCIEANAVSQFWIVNNTCYVNNLDRLIADAGSITAGNSRDGFIVNNIVVSGDSSHPAYDQQSSNVDIRYFTDLYSGSFNNFTYSDPSQFILADPMFVDPPQINPTALAPFATVIAPSLLGDGLNIQQSSPALHRGIDPTTLLNLPEAIVTDLKKYFYTDIKGNLRPRGKEVDLGAYQL
jgi:hypothetical protein